MKFEESECFLKIQKAILFLFQLFKQNEDKSGGISRFACLVLPPMTTPFISFYKIKSHRVKLDRVFFPRWSSKVRSLFSWFTSTKAGTVRIALILLKRKISKKFDEIMFTELFSIYCDENSIQPTCLSRVDE